MLAGAGAIGGGAIVAAFTALAGVVFTYLAQRANNRSKRSETEIAAIALGQNILREGLDRSEKSNKELRVDLLAAERRIEELEMAHGTHAQEVAALRHTIKFNDDLCARKLRALAHEIQRLKGTAPDVNE